MESMVLTASEAELLKGNANLIELLPGSDDSTVCEGSNQQHLPLTYKRLKHLLVSYHKGTDTGKKRW